MTPEPWEDGYKPPTAAEAFDPSRPLPRSAVEALAFIDRKDERIAELEDTLRALFRFASSQHREIYASNVTTREWEDMRSRVKATLFPTAEVEPSDG